MQVEIDGKAIHNIEQFHQHVAQVLDLGSYYGKNLNALWDSLSANVERPLKLVWRDSNISRQYLGEESFKMIVDIFKDVQDEDSNADSDEKFEFELC